MPIPPDQLERATRALTAYCNDVPERARDRIRFGFRLKGNAIVLFESHPYFQNRKRWIDHPVAKFRFYASRGEWHLYWMDRSLKWRLYEWFAPRRTFSPLLAEVERDPTFLFWG